MSNLSPKQNQKKIEEKNNNQELQQTPESEIEKNNEEYLSENH